MARPDPDGEIPQGQSPLAHLSQIGGMFALLLADLATKCVGLAVCNENGHSMGSQLGSETEVSSVADQAWHPEVWLSCVSAWQSHINGPDRRSDGSPAGSARALRTADTDGVHARCHR
jgi:hypothetical protein